MQAYSYGATPTAGSSSAEARHLAELRYEGFCVVPDVLASAELSAAREKLDAVYARQELETGPERLAKILDLDVARSPLVYDPWFLRLAADETILGLVRKVLGDYVLLNLQNGIINRPDRSHRQSSWHRDLPYQEWTSSKPLGLSALFCLDAFAVATGGTLVLPHSHAWERLPPVDFVERHAISVVAQPGSVILFNSMLFHRTGHNTSDQLRRGINHVYTIPLLKQQIDLPRALNGSWAEDPRFSQLLGYTSQSAESVAAWRNAKILRQGG